MTYVSWAVIAQKLPLSSLVSHPNWRVHMNQCSWNESARSRDATYLKLLQGWMTQWPTARWRCFSFSRASLLPNSFIASLLSETWKNAANWSRTWLPAEASHDDAIDHRMPVVFRHPPTLIPVQSAESPPLSEVVTLSPPLFCRPT